jgi:hypothetical protein
LLGDAELFDRLLDYAPQYDVTRLDGLKKRIAAAAEHQPRLVATQPQAARPTVLRRHQGLAATALAASLVLGVLAGQSRIVNSFWGSSQNSSNATRQIAQTDDGDILLDEDML